MIIINKSPLALIVVKDYIKDIENKQMADYLKKFTKLAVEKPGKITEEIRALSNPKIKEEDIVKVLDFLPEDTEDLNKIFTEVSLTEDETKAILDIIKKY